MTDPIKLAADLQALADKWADERWPSAHDYPERDAAKEAYLAALLAYGRDHTDGGGSGGC